MDKRNLNNYLSLCAELYDIDKAKIESDEVLFYFQYAQEANGLILEPMCGTGRFLIPFTKAGFLIEGFDASQYMLNILLRKSDLKNIKPKVWKGLLQDLDVKERYDLIFIPDASFNLLLSEEDINLSLNNIYKHLNLGGKFVFELATLEYMKTIEENERKTFSTKIGNGKVIYQNIGILPFKGRIVTTKSYCQLHDKRDNVEQIEIEEVSLLFHDPREVVQFLQKVGFQQIKLLKAFDRDVNANEEDKIIIFECMKGKNKF